MLVATDVASRGIDIPDLSLIIQIEPPQDINSYIHRAGRTARAGKVGTCITFYNSHNYYQLNKIRQIAHVDMQIAAVPLNPAYANYTVEPTPMPQSQ